MNEALNPSPEDPIRRHVEENLNLLDDVAWGMAHRCRMDKDELRQMGYRGLVHAARTFNEANGLTFDQYARLNIRFAIIGELKNLRHAPAGRRNERIFEANVEKLKQKLGREPYGFEIDELGTRPQKIPDIILLDDEPHNPNDKGYEEPSAHIPDVAQEKNIRDFWNKRMGKYLTKNETACLDLIFFEYITQAQVALRLGLTRSRIGQLIKGALEKMATALESEEASLLS